MSVIHGVSMANSPKGFLMAAMAAVSLAGCGPLTQAGLLPESTPAADAQLAHELTRDQTNTIAFVKCTNSMTGEVLGSGVARGTMRAEGSRFGTNSLTYTDYATGQQVTIAARLRNAFTCTVQGVDMQSANGGLAAIISDTTEFAATDTRGQVMAADTATSSGVAFSVSRYTNQLDWRRDQTGNNVAPAFVSGATMITARGASFNR